MGDRGPIHTKRITVTGGNGFLGTHLVRQMREKGYERIAVADLPEFNLVSIADVRRLYEETRPDIVIHLAAKVGGIGFNQENPASLFYENAIMGIQLMHEAYIRRVDKFVALGTICAYPKFTPTPFREEDLWNGYPEETNAPYGMAKKMMLVQSQAYRRQYGFNSIFLLPVNLYGPGDNFGFKSSHVIPALIRKLYLAELLSKGDFAGILRDFQFNHEMDFLNKDKPFTLADGSSVDDLLAALFRFGVTDREKSAHLSLPVHRHSEAVVPAEDGRPASVSSSAVVEVWGTGTATREFFYVEDAAEAIILAMERYNKSEPVNIGAGFEISIRELVDLLVDFTAYKGRVVWDTTKPDGQPRRMLDTSRASEEFGFKAKTGFREGLRKTIEWYRRNSGKC